MRSCCDCWSGELQKARGRPALGLIAQCPALTLAHQATVDPEISATLPIPPQQPPTPPQLPLGFNEHAAKHPAEQATEHAPAEAAMHVMEPEEDEQAAAAAQQARAAAKAAKRQRQKQARQRAQQEQAAQQAAAGRAPRKDTCCSSQSSEKSSSSSNGRRSEGSSPKAEVACMLQHLGMAQGRASLSPIPQPQASLSRPVSPGEQAGDDAAVEELLQLLGLSAHT